MVIKKYKAYTLAEVVVAMLLTIIVIGVLFSTLRSFGYDMISTRKYTALEILQTYSAEMIAEKNFHEHTVNIHEKGMVSVKIKPIDESQHIHKCVLVFFDSKNERVAELHNLIYID